MNLNTGWVQENSNGTTNGSSWQVSVELGLQSTRGTVRSNNLSPDNLSSLVWLWSLLVTTLGSSQVGNSLSQIEFSLFLGSQTFKSDQDSVTVLSRLVSLESENDTSWVESVIYLMLLFVLVVNDECDTKRNYLVRKLVWKNDFGGNSEVCVCSTFKASNLFEKAFSDDKNFDFKLFDVTKANLTAMNEWNTHVLLLWWRW